MSLIADSLKKAQTERDHEPGHWADAVLRSSTEKIPGYSKSLLFAVAAVPIVFLGIWYVLLPGLSEKSVVTQTADISNHTVLTGVQGTSLETTTTGLDEKEIQADSTETLVEGQPLVTEINPNEEMMEASQNTGQPENQIKPVHAVESTVAPVKEEPIMVSSHMLAKLKPVETPVKEETFYANEKTIDDQKKKKEAPFEIQTVKTPEVKKETLKEQPKTVLVPFVKSQSPLEKVASLTQDLQQEPVPVQINPEPVVPVEEPPVLEPVAETQTVTFKNENESVEVQITPEVTSSGTSDQQVAKLETQETKSGDITVIPDQDFMDSMSKSTALRGNKPAMHEKTRYFNIAALHHKRQDYFEALKYYDKAAKLDPGNAQIFNNRALVFQKLGRRNAAIEELQHAIHINSRYVKAYNNLGLLYYYSGDYLAAINSFEKALEIDPRNVESYNNLAILYKQRKEYAQAKNLYRKVILLEPGQAEAHYNLALLYEETGELSSAIKYYRLFVETGSKSRPDLAIQVRDHIKKLEELSHS